MMVDRTRTEGDRGFTLIELMTVVLIIALLLAIAVATFVATTASANAASCKYNQRVLNDASAVVECSVNADPIDELEDLRPYVKNFDNVKDCPSDGTELQLDAATGEIYCPNHP